jgi:threonine/homoserine/homoserine lactone efflux protein
MPLAPRALVVAAAFVASVLVADLAIGWTWLDVGLFFTVDALIAGCYAVQSTRLVARAAYGPHVRLVVCRVSGMILEC